MPESKSSRLLESSQILSNVAVIISALVILPLYLLEREDTNRLERQQLAAQMFMRKYDDRMTLAYAKVSEAYDSRNSLFPIFSGPQEDGKKDLARSIVSDAGLANIKMVVDYYEDILVCAQQGLCDKKLTDSLIGQDIRIFYCKARFAGLPELRVKYDYPQYGRRIERFSGDCKFKIK